MNNQVDANFMVFRQDISSIELPSTFTFPFDYTPHPLTISAANQLQHYLETQQDWVHNFGTHPENDSSIMGKMFGVLVVRNEEGELGYLQAYSGILAGKTRLPSFVPPIFDRQEPAFEYTQKEDEILVINQAMIALEKASVFIDAQNNLDQYLSQEGEALKSQKSALKTAKKKRQKLRKEVKGQIPDEEYAILLSAHERESRQYDLSFKSEQKKFLIKKAELELRVAPFLKQLSDYKNLRKAKSAETQQIIFNQYQFKNYLGQYKSVDQIFSEKKSITPPSGAGDCAAPKLFQYAFENNYTPISLAEFWWGKSPNLEVRQHKNYYPACKAKCHPILSFMLKGLDLDPNPVMSHQPEDLVIEILYEDDWIIVIDKPAYLLSVPGKELKDSVQNRMKAKYPNATGPMIVHRLDMGTSGIMILAKDLKTYHHLQQQFISRTIQKQYTAKLDGVPLDKDSVINLPLRVDLNNRPHQVVCYDHGKPAETRWELLDTKNGKSMVRFFPHTGRTHQLRVHASHPKGLNIPIYGDELYGNRLDRLYLHASQLDFVHPYSQKRMCLESPAPFLL